MLRKSLDKILRNDLDRTIKFPKTSFLPFSPPHPFSLRHPFSLSTSPAMLRRQTRLRREFLYTKSLEQKERQIHERKQRVKDLLAKGKEVPRGQGVGEREGRMDDGGNGESRASSSFFLGRGEGGMGRGGDWMGCVGGERKV